MAYIQSHQEISRHPKIKRLARLLAIGIPAAVGHLHIFWHWALDYAQDGSLSKYDDAEIADAAMWDGDCELFVKSMVQSGLFAVESDNAIVIHDWHDYAGKLIDQRQANASRMKNARNNDKIAQNTHVQNMCNARAEHVQDTCNAHAEHVHDMCDACAGARVEKSIVEKSREEKSQSPESVNINKSESYIALHAHSDERVMSQNGHAPKSFKPDKPDKPDKPRSKVIPPPRDWFIDYFAELGHPELAEECFDYWESVGWKRGGRLMVDWQATARTRIRAIESGAVRDPAIKAIPRKGPYDKTLEESYLEIQATRDKLRGIRQ